jgi:hypothetical protein
VQLVHDWLDAVGIALREKVSEIIEGFDGSELVSLARRRPRPVSDRVMSATRPSKSPFVASILIVNIPLNGTVSAARIARGQWQRAY